MKIAHKTLKTFLLTLFIITSSFTLDSCSDKAEPRSYSIYDVAKEIIDWNNFEFKDVCTFKIPPTMEVRQNVNLTLIMDNLTTTAMMLCGDCDPYQLNTKIVLQPLGIDAVTTGNNYESNPFSHYARIMISLHECADINKENVLRLTDNELNYIEKELMKTQRNFYNCMSEYKASEGDFKWEYLHLVMVNDQPGLEYSFLRPGEKGVVKVNAFAIYLDGNNMAEVTCSYRLSDSNLFKKDIENFIYTLRFK